MCNLPVNKGNRSPLALPAISTPISTELLSLLDLVTYDGSFFVIFQCRLAGVLHGIKPTESDMNFRKIVLAAILGVLLVPGLALAGGRGHENDSISAQEITQIGLAGAVVLGAVGYLALRRRSQQPKK